MSETYPVAVDKVLNVLDEEFRNRELTLDSISESVFIDKYHLCRVFKRSMGITIQEYLFRKRINYFKTLATENPQYPLSLLMIKSGFVSYRSLSHHLKMHYQITIRELITKGKSIR